MSNLKFSEEVIRNVVTQVLAEVGPRPSVPATGSCGCASQTGVCQCSSSATFAGYNGVFQDAEQAIAAASEAFDLLSQRGKDDRKKAIDQIRRIVTEQSVELGTLEMNETNVGRVEHKIGKLEALGEKAPGIEFMNSQVYSGDHGLAVIEHAPFGVIGAITPVTHSLPTIAGNAVNMIAGGNTVVVNPHPSGKRIAAEGVRRFNEAIQSEIGIDNLICVVAEPSLESADVIFKHRDVKLICVTGGPMVARAALQSGKRAVVAGPGNPPVVVDETADLENAARSIIAGASFDNNLLCIAEKQVFVVDSVFDQLMSAMERVGGAVRLNHAEVAQFTSVAIVQVGDDHHDAPSRDFLGKDAAVLAQGIGKSVPADTQLLFGETDEHNPFVAVEQMMPFVPFIRCQNVDEAIEKARVSEHGFRHTSIIHSNSVRNMTRMGRIMDTTLFVKNGPCMAGLGLGGEGYLSFSIAGPTGEGVTTPLTFTRERRCSLVDDLCILGKPKS